MNESMGEVIRRLRKEKSITQEELAELLGVTSQAVSKWESGAGMPDIAQIVPLCNVFDVPADVLFGRNAWTADEEIDQIVEQIDEKYEKWSERLNALIEAWKRYPDHRELLQKIVYYASWSMQYVEGEERDQFLETGLRAAERFLALYKDIGSQMSMMEAKVQMLARGGRFDEAEEIAKQYSAKLLNDHMLLAEIAHIKQDYREEIRQHQESLVQLLEAVVWETARMAHAYDDLGMTKKAYLCHQANLRLPELYSGNDRFKPPFGNVFGSLSGMHAAACLTRLGRHEEALDLLEKCFDEGELACECAPGDWETLTTPLLDGIDTTPFRGKMLMRDNVWSIVLPEFDPLRKTERFKKLMERYNNYPAE